MKKLIQIMGDGIEELYYVPEETKYSDVKKAYADYSLSDYEDFTDFCEDNDIPFERAFVDLITVYP